MSEFWTGLWTLVLSTGLFLFAALAVIVAISGLIQLRKLVRAASGKASAQDAPVPPGGAGESRDTPEADDAT